VIIGKKGINGAIIGSIHNWDGLKMGTGMKPAKTA
jgi:hypothetical protein